MNYKQIEKSAVITKLPSGFYALWIAGNWINAALPSENAAIAYMEAYIKEAATKKNLKGSLHNNGHLPVTAQY